MRIITGTLLIGLALSISACGLMPKQEADKTDKPVKSEQGEPIKASAPVQMVDEFDDIQVPAELSRNDEQSSVYEAPGLVFGVIVYEGYVKPMGISKFFRTTMPTYEWQFINAFSEGKHYTLTFIKANRSCTISIVESSFSTRIVIRVGPTGAN
jgi:hypothetical protein